MCLFLALAILSGVVVLEAQTMPRPTKPGELMANFTVRFTKFSNPGHMMADGQRCDSGWFSSNKCDPHLTACFMKTETAWSANATSKSMDKCDFAGPFSSGPYDNTGEVVFANMPGLFQKPIVMNISHAWHGVVMRVQVDEMERGGFLGANTAKGPLVDSFSYFFNGRPAGSILKLKLTGLTSANTSLELEAKIQCLPNYYDAKCSTYCVPSPADHFTCDPKTGQIVCSSGWTGDFCNAKILSDHLNIRPFELGTSADEVVAYEMEPVNMTSLEIQLGENQTAGYLELEAVQETSTPAPTFEIHSAVVTEIVPPEDPHFEKASTDEPHFDKHQGSEVIFESHSSNVTAEAVTSGVSTIRPTSYSSVWPLTVSLVVGGLSYLATTAPSASGSDIPGKMTSNSTEKADTTTPALSTESVESTTVPVFLDELVTLREKLFNETTKEPEMFGSFLLPVSFDNVTADPAVTFGTVLLDDLDVITEKPDWDKKGMEKVEKELEGDKEGKITPSREIKAFESTGNETKLPGLGMEMEFVPVPATTPEPALANGSFNILNVPVDVQLTTLENGSSTTPILLVVDNTIAETPRTTSGSTELTSSSPETTEAESPATDSSTTSTISSTVMTTMAGNFSLLTQNTTSNPPTEPGTSTSTPTQSTTSYSPTEPESSTATPSGSTSIETTSELTYTQMSTDVTWVESTAMVVNASEATAVSPPQANVNDVNVVLPTKLKTSDTNEKLISSLSYDLGATSGMYGSYFINSEFLDQLNRTVYQAVAHRIYTVNATWGSLAHIATGVEFSGLSATSKSVGPQITVHITVNGQPAFTVTDFRSIVDDALFRGRLISPGETGKTANLYSDFTPHSPGIIIFMALLGVAIVILVGVIIILSRKPHSRRCLRSPFTDSDLNNTTSRSCSLAASSYENPVFLEPRSPYVADEENISLEPRVYAEATRNGCGETAVTRMIFSPKIGCHGSHPSISQRTTTTFEQKSSGGTL